MNSSELLHLFRSHTTDTLRPYAWSDVEVYTYAGEAQSMFSRLTGGVSDVLSVATDIEVKAGDPWSDLHPSVLRIMDMTLRSQKRPIQAVNHTDIGRLVVGDYHNTLRPLTLEDQPGAIRYGVIGLQPGKIRWVMVPEADDMVDAHIYRTPLQPVNGPEQELEDVAVSHHFYLLYWMLHLAHKKGDEETFDLKSRTTTATSSSPTATKSSASGSGTSTKPAS